MIPKRTKVSGISWYLVSCFGLWPVWFRFTPRHHDHKSSRSPRANGAGLVRSVAGRWTSSGRKAAIPSAVSQAKAALRGNPEIFLLTLLASINLGLAILLTLGELR